jgi:hypothetical protein
MGRANKTMKKIVIVFLCFFVTPLVSADDFKFKGYIKPDPLRGANHYLILNDDGHAKARLKPDPIRSSESGYYLIIDKDGNESGRIRPDYLNKDSYIIETDMED